MPQSLRDIRLIRGHLQRAVAEAVGVSVASVSRWENGDDEPSAPTRPPLAKFLKISPQKLNDAIAESRRRGAQSTLDKIGQVATSGK